MIDDSSGSMSFFCSAGILNFSVVNCLGTVRLTLYNAVIFKVS